MADDSVQVKFGAQTSDLEDGITRARTQLDQLGAAFQSAFKFDVYTSAFDQLKGIFDSIESFFNTAQKPLEYVLQISQRLGVTTESASGLRVALNSVNVSTEDFLGIMQRMDRQLRANEGSFNALGIQTRDQNYNWRNQADILLDVIAKLETYKAGTDRNQAAITLLGGRVGDLTNLMRLNKDTLREGAEEASRLNVVFGQDAIAAMLQYKTTMAEIDEVHTALKVQIAQQLEPTLIGYANWMKTNGVESMKTFTASIQGVLVGITYLTTGVQILGNEFAKFKSIVAEFASGDAEVVAKVHQIADEYDKNAKAIAKNGLKAYYSIFGLDENGSPLPKPQTPTPSLPPQGTQTFSAPVFDNKLALNDIATEEQIAKYNLETQKAILGQEAAFHQLTKQQEIEQDKQAADQAYAIDQEALEEKLALYTQGSIDYKETLNQMDVLEAQHTATIAKLDQKMAQEQQHTTQQMYQSWLHALQPIESAFDGMLQGVLQGTETIGQALANAFANASISVIESIAKIIAEWLVFEAVTEGQGTWADFVSVQKGGVGGSAGLLGGLGALVGVFDSGTAYVPQTGLAMIHQGEMIIPAQQAQSIREGGFGGGDTYNVTINAVDAQSVANLLKNNSAVITQIVNRSTRNFSGSVPIWKAN